MTRARDELVLTHAADYGGKRTRRVSPFVLQALDLPQARVEPATAAPSALERMSRMGVADASPPAAARSTGGPLSLSFYQVDDYLTCPAKYRYVHVLRLPIAPHHAIVYGAALHRAAQELHRRQAQGDAISEEDLIEVFDRAWSNEGFLTREHEEARREAGHAALLRFRAEQLAPGATVPTYVEKEFSFMYGGDRVRGRWDRVDVVAAPEEADGATATPPAGWNGAGEGPDPVPAVEAVPAVAAVSEPDDLGGLDLVTPTLPFGQVERVTIVDYKSSDVRDPAQARQRARESLQLGIYALAWRSVTGRLPDAVALHFIGTGVVGSAEVDAARMEKVGEAIARAAAGIRTGAYGATPGYVACSYCAFREICPSSAAR
jgi:DNA helicase-2/ATP-dependent DNA helicase PcrA